MDVDATLQESFDRIEQAVRYRQWILDSIRPFIGSRVLEVGCGVGNFTTELLPLVDLLVAVDVEEPYVRELSRRAGAPEGLLTLCASVMDAAIPRLRRHELDTAVLLNVLEHVDDDVGALRSVSLALKPGAAIIIQVPAHTWLYGSMDAALGHKRRYSRPALARTLRGAGLEVEHLWEQNMLGIAGWFWNGVVRGEGMFPSSHLSLYESVVPILRAAEGARGAPLGLSLFAVARAVHVTQ